MNRWLWICKWVPVQIFTSVYAISDLQVKSLELCNPFWQCIVLVISTVWICRDVWVLFELHCTRCLCRVTGHRSQSVDGADNKVLFQGEVCQADALWAINYKYNVQSAAALLAVWEKGQERGEWFSRTHTLKLCLICDIGSPQQPHVSRMYVMTSQSCSDTYRGTSSAAKEW